MFSKILKFLSPMQWAEIILIVVVGLVVFNVGGSMIESIQSKFGIETKEELKQKTSDQSKIINDISNINKDSIRALGIIDNSNMITKESIVTNLKSEAKLNTEFQKIKTKKEDRIEQIKNSFNAEPITVDNTLEMEKQVSNQQITALWEMYCSGNSSSEQCRGINRV